MPTSPSLPKAMPRISSARKQLERVQDPHFLQGVKAVLSLDAAEIEKRFGLGPEEGAAYELLLRNPTLGGRTAQLNIGAFLYTNRDSISLGYVAPLENIRDNFRGSHDRVYEWMCGLPYIRDLIRGANLSAYGTKLIRSGGAARAARAGRGRICRGRRRDRARYRHPLPELHRPGFRIWPLLRPGGQEHREERRFL